MFNNGIDASLYDFAMTNDDAKQALGLDGKTIILFVGRLDPVKSLPTLLDAFSFSLDRVPDLHLIIVGDGPDRIPLEKRSRELHLESKVDFKGNQRDVIPYLQAADMFVLCSETEGISNALLEAMSARVACLATPVGGNLEVLAGGKHGLMVPVGDVKAWADAIVKVACDTDLRTKLGRSARERILEQYDFNVVGRRYEDLYHELAGGSMPASQHGRMVHK